MEPQQPPLPPLEFDYERALMDCKYILAGLIMYGDMLAECIADPALTAEERQEFLGDQVEVERLVIEYQDSVQEYEEEM